MDRKVLFDIWHAEKDKSKQQSAVLSYIIRIINSDNFSENYHEYVYNQVRLFCKHLTKRWIDSNRTLKQFITKNYDWLSGQAATMAARASEQDCSCFKRSHA